jgi:hypothetical protein
LEIIGQRRKLHAGELHDLYSLPDIIRVIILGILRYIFGAVQGKSAWRKRFKYELYKLFIEPDINHIKINRLSWAG